MDITPASDLPHSQGWELYNSTINTTIPDMDTFFNSINSSGFTDDMQSVMTELKSHYDSKLYFELSNAVEKFLKMSNYEPLEKLIFFNVILGQIAERIGPLQFINTLSYVISDCEPDVALGFLQNFSTKVEKFDDKGAQLYYYCTQAYHFAKIGYTAMSEKLLDIVDKEIETVIDLDLSVYSAYFQGKMEFQLVKERYEELCQSTLLYFYYTPLDSITPETKLKYAKRLAVYSMVAKKLYNFGDILQLSPINNELNSSEYGWLVEFLTAFNGGDIVGFRSLLNQHMDGLNSLNLTEHLDQMNEKIIILALMDFAFEKPKNERLIEFEKFAHHCEIDYDEVEKYLMKAMSMKLIDGKIDGVKQAAQITWVKPRILDPARLQLMKTRMDKWITHTEEVLNQIVGNVCTELLTASNA